MAAMTADAGRADSPTGAGLEPSHAPGPRRGAIGPRRWSGVSPAWCWRPPGNEVLMRVKALVIAATAQPPPRWLRPALLAVRRCCTRPELPTRIRKSSALQGEQWFRCADLLLAVRTPRVALCRQAWLCQQFLSPEAARCRLQSPPACSPSCSPVSGGVDEHDVPQSVPGHHSPGAEDRPVRQPGDDDPAGLSGGLGQQCGTGAAAASGYPRQSEKQRQPGRLQVRHGQPDECSLQARRWGMATPIAVVWVSPSGISAGATLLGAVPRERWPGRWSSLAT